MLDFKKKKKYKRIIYSKYFVFLLCLILFFVAKSAIDIYGKERQTRASVNDLNAKKIQLEDRLETLERLNEKFETDRGLEEEIRVNFPVARQDEGVIIIVDSELEIEMAEEEKRDGFWRSIKRFFKRD